MNLSIVFGSVGTGIIVGFVLSYPVAFVRELARLHASRLMTRRAADRERRQVARAAAGVAAEQERTFRLRAERVRQLEHDRVGARFVHRVTGDDAGLVGTVVSLDRRQPEQGVVVQFEPTAGRSPSPHDPSLLTPIGVDWGVLVKAPAEQRRWVARMIEHSHDDADGWLLFERVG